MSTLNQPLTPVSALDADLPAPAIRRAHFVVGLFVLLGAWAVLVTAVRILWG